MKQWLVRRFVFPYADLFLAVSEHVKTNLIKEGVREEKIRVVYNIVDEERFFYEEKKAEPIGVLFVGKLAEGKGVMDFAQAFSSLVDKGINIRGFIVGEGKLRKRLEEYIKEKGLHHRLVLTGYVEKVEEYYKKSHVCVVPSRETEAFPRTALEALACGCALVVSHIGGTKEAVVEGKNGFVFRAGDVEDLKEKLQKAVENWQAFSQASLSLYRDKFSKEKVLHSFLRALESLL